MTGREGKEEGGREGEISHSPMELIIHIWRRSDHSISFFIVFLPSFCLPSRSSIESLSLSIYRAFLIMFSALTIDSASMKIEKNFRLLLLFRFWQNKRLDIRIDARPMKSDSSFDVCLAADRSPSRRLIYNQFDYLEIHHRLMPSADIHTLVLVG